MSKRFGAILLSLPALAISASAGFAAPAETAVQAPVISAPAPDQTATPAGCNGCAGHDCANCPLMQAAAEHGPTQPPAKPEINCGTN